MEPMDASGVVLFANFYSKESIKAQMRAAVTVAVVLAEAGPVAQGRRVLALVVTLLHEERRFDYVLLATDRQHRQKERERDQHVL